MNIFIVEDNARHLNLLRTKVETLNHKVVGASQDASEAIVAIKKTSPDIVLVDINLRAETDGITLAKQIKSFSDASILFVTSQSKDQIIQSAVAIDPIGYLLKPVNINDLKANLELAIYKRTQAKNKTKVTPKNEFLTIRRGKKLQVLHFKDIIFIKVEVKNHVTLVDNTGKEFSIRDSLKSLLDKILSDCFMRTHHSYAVNIDYVLFIDEKEQMLYLKTNNMVPIGMGFKKAVYKKLKVTS